MASKYEKSRYLYIDNLRLLIIIFVVMVHLAVTYSGIGGWYFTDTKEELDTVSYVVFGLFQSFTQAYFMGFLFLISGFFIVKSYGKKGAGRFLKERFIRLGIPTLIYMLVINPFINYVVLGHTLERPMFLTYYIDYIKSFEFVGESGPLWFAFALLLFTIVYVLYRRFTRSHKIPTERKLPGTSSILILILIISVCAFLIRLVQPIDTDILNMQLCFFSQYIILFMVGIRAGRYDWFSNLPYKTGRRWFISAISLGIILWLVLMVTGGALEGGFDIYKGGLSWQSAAYAVWESFISVAMGIGLITLFREKHNKQNKLLKTMSDNSFGVYMFHAPIIIAVSLAFVEIEMHPLVKFLVTAAIGIPLSFLLSHYIFKRIPGLKKVL